jgi:hypothetical protein
MALGIWFVSMGIATSYIIYKIGLENKRYGIKTLVVSMDNLIECYMQPLPIFMLHINLVYLLIT